jgi:hypothetical protein
LASGGIDAMSPKRSYRIDGAAFDDLDGFYDEIERQMLDGAPSDRSFQSLSDLFGGKGTPIAEPFEVVWEHSDLSRRRLGTHGPGSFSSLVEVFSANPNIELVLS